MPVLSVLVEDAPGVLARVAALFSRRAYNISSLAVGATESPGRSRLTVVVDVEPEGLHQVVEQLRKLVEVISVVEVPELGIELGVFYAGSTDAEVLAGAGAREVGNGIFELTGSTAALDEVVAHLPEGVKVARSGLVAAPTE